MLSHINSYLRSIAVKPFFSSFPTCLNSEARSVVSCIDAWKRSLFTVSQCRDVTGEKKSLSAGRVTPSFCSETSAPLFSRVRGVHSGSSETAAAPSFTQARGVHSGSSETAAHLFSQARGVHSGSSETAAHLFSQARDVHPGSSESDYLDDDDDEEEERDPEKAADKLLQDIDEDAQVRQFYGVPGSGHLLYIVQPVAKRAPLEDRDVLTTPELQLEEATALVHSIPGWQVANTEILRVNRIKSKHIFGPGQLDILTKTIRQTGGVSAVFVAVDHLTGLQLTTLQRRWHLPIFDRTSMVLQIFREHARTKEAKLQVALAELPYIRSRMDELEYGEVDTSAARFAQKTGELYLNARIMLLQRREAKLKKALEALKSQRSIVRERRIKRNIPTVAVIGYTNSGKTTLIKALTGDKALAPRDQLFATLDVTAHAGYLPNSLFAVFMDTVGFMSNLPKSLATAFAATLEDAMSADLIVHVRDISHPNRLSQREEVVRSVESMLNDTQMQTMIEVCNKVDKIHSLDEVREDREGVFYISSATGDGLDVLRQEVETRLLVNAGLLQKRIRVPMAGEHLSWLYKEATVTDMEEDYDTENVIVHVIITKENYARFVSRFGNKAKTKARGRYE